MELVKVLKTSETKYDYFVVTAGIWPDWNERYNHDGLDKGLRHCCGRTVFIVSPYAFLGNTRGARLEYSILASGI